jgi:hypothetical protein
MQMDWGREYHKLSSFFITLVLPTLCRVHTPISRMDRLSVSTDMLLRLDSLFLLMLPCHLNYGMKLSCQLLFLLIVSLHLFLIIFLPLRSCLVLNQRTPFYARSVVPVGRTYTHIIPISLLFILRNVPSLDTILIIRDINVWISLRVVFTSPVMLFLMNLCFHFPSFTLMQVPGFGPRSLFYLHRLLILCHLGY